LRGPVARILNVVFVARSNERSRPWAELRGLSRDTHLQFAFADQEQHLLLMAMPVVRRAARQQKYFVDINVVTTVREAIENGAKSGVRFLLRKEPACETNRRPTKPKTKFTFIAPNASLCRSKSCRLPLSPKRLQGRLSLAKPDGHGFGNNT
jgi:hypothetical protein